MIKPVKFIPCNESSQIYTYQRTNKKAKHIDLTTATTSKKSTKK